MRLVDSKFTFEGMTKPASLSGEAPFDGLRAFELVETAGGGKGKGRE